jgi:hypothetical protein
MTTLALETINGTPLLVAKGERCEVYTVAPEFRDNVFLPTKLWVMENGGLCFPHSRPPY